MPKVTLTDTDVSRLEEERGRADRAYNDALTGVDQALTPPPPLPAPPPPPDDHQVGRLNTAWDIVGSPALPTGGWKGRLAAFVWRIVAPMLQRQQEFNAALVDHVNRTHARTAESREAVAALADALSAQLAALARFQARLIVYLQQITPYVDTKDRHEAGQLRYRLERETGGVAAGLDALGDELLKRWESAMARERRFDARVEELRGRLARSPARVRGAAGGTAPRGCPGRSRGIAPRAVEGTAPSAAEGTPPGVTERPAPA